MNGNFEHIEATEYSGFACIESGDVAGLVHLAEASHVKFIFRKGAKDKDSAPEEFFFHAASVVYKIKAQGYIHLEDFYHAVVKKFPSSEEFYEAKKKGYDSYEEFKHSKGASDGGKETFDEAKSAGFVHGFDIFEKKYAQYKANKHTALIEEDINSPLKLYEYAQRKGFSNWHDFERAYDAHYPDAAVFSDATAKGFKTADDYFDAVNKGFTVPLEYTMAKEKMIGTKKEYDDYRYLKACNSHPVENSSNGTNHLSYDEFHLLELLKEMENGKKLLLRQIRNALEDDQEKYKRTFTGSTVKVLPSWYIQKIGKEESLHAFLSNNADVKKLGTYNPKDKIFEIFREGNTKVYIDASNVGHNGNRNDRVAFYKNIRLVVQELKDAWNFPEIVVIADASLRHKAKDTDELARIKKLAQYHEAPSKTQADKFLLDYIHREKCIIVSNDTFSDWKENDFWIRKNIDRLRIPFMIKDDAVSLYGIEKHSKAK